MPAPEQLCSPRPCPVPTLFHLLPATLSFRTAGAALAEEVFQTPLSSWAGGPDTLCFPLIAPAPELAWPIHPYPHSQKLIESWVWVSIFVFQLLVHWHSGSVSQMPIKVIKPARLTPGPALLLSGLKILVENLLCAQPSTGTLLGILTS